MMLYEPHNHIQRQQDQQHSQQQQLPFDSNNNSTNNNPFDGLQTNNSSQQHHHHHQQQSSQQQQHGIMSSSLGLVQNQLGLHDQVAQHRQPQQQQHVISAQQQTQTSFVSQAHFQIQQQQLQLQHNQHNQLPNSHEQPQQHHQQQQMPMQPQQHLQHIQHLQQRTPNSVITTQTQLKNQALPLILSPRLTPNPNDQHQLVVDPILSFKNESSDISSMLSNVDIQQMQSQQQQQQQQQATSSFHSHHLDSSVSQSPPLMSRSESVGVGSVGGGCGEEVTKKRELRLLKNREAAKECRRKKKEYIKCLENRVGVLETQNKALIDELKTLKDLYSKTGEIAKQQTMTPQQSLNQVSICNTDIFNDNIIYQNDKSE